TVNDGIKRFGQFAHDTIRQSARQAMSTHDEDQQRKGFSSAAGITLRQIDARLDALKERMTGAGMTKSEQAVYAELDELRSAIEAECDWYWEGTAVDWRPVKPVATRAVGRTEEPES